MTGVKLLQAICTFSVMWFTIGAAFDRFIMEVSVLFAPNPLIRFYKSLTGFSFSISAGLFAPGPPFGFTNELTLI